jgi:hypothetical protein
MNSITSDIISKLKFISRIKAGQKIDTRAMRIQENTYFNAFIRTLFPDNRHNALGLFKEIITKAFQSIAHCDDNILVCNIIDDIRNCISGLENFKTTYLDDVMFTCEIDTLVDDIELKLGQQDTGQLDTN